MRSKNLKLILIFTIITNLVIFGLSSKSKNDSIPLPITSSIGIDGIITEEEWSNADWNISFYLDVNNTADWNGKINVDGNNTMYLGQDRSNLYIALDLWCDRSNNETGEWLGVWLNTNNRTFNGAYEWLPYLNDGAESIIHDVEKAQTWEPFIDTIGVDTFYLEDDNAYNPFYGVIEGNHENFKYNWRNDFNITSELVSGNYLYRLDFSIDLEDWLPLDEFFDVIQGIEVLVNSRSNITIDDHKILFWFSDGSMPLMTDTDQVKDLNTGTSYVSDYIYWDFGNLTADRKFQFSLYGNHTDSFMTNLNVLNFNVHMNNTVSPLPIYAAYTSIKNYQIDWGFGPSPGNSTDHRMFEISIPKSELEHFKSNRELGIVVGGYGTMAINGTNYWCFSKVDTHIPFTSSSQYNYYEMIGIPSKAIPGYNLLLILATLGLISIVLVKKKLEKI